MARLVEHIIEHDRYRGGQIYFFFSFLSYFNFYFSPRKGKNRFSRRRKMKNCSIGRRAIRDFRFDSIRFDSTGSRQIGSWRGIFIGDDFRANNAAHCRYLHERINIWAPSILPTARNEFQSITRVTNLRPSTSESNGLHRSIDTFAKFIFLIFNWHRIIVKHGGALDMKLIPAQMAIIENSSSSSFLSQRCNSIRAYLFNPFREISIKIPSCFKIYIEHFLSFRPIGYEVFYFD